MVLHLLPVYVTPETVELVEVDVVLILKQLSESVTLFPMILMSLTVTSLEMEPTEIPWPPLHWLFWKVMLVPLLMARQSSWFLTMLGLVSGLAE